MRASGARRWRVARKATESTEEVATLLRSGEVNEIGTLHRERVSVSAISSLTGFDRKTIRKYLHAGGIPRCGPRCRCQPPVEPA